MFGRDLDRALACAEHTHKGGESGLDIFSMRVALVEELTSVEGGRTEDSWGVFGRVWLPQAQSFLLVASQVFEEKIDHAALGHQLLYELLLGQDR